MNTIVKTVLLCLTFSLAGTAIGQQHLQKFTVLVHGKVNKVHTTHPVSNAKICILRENDTLQITQSDAKGNYAVSIDVEGEDQLEIHAKARHYDISRNLLIVTPGLGDDYEVDLELVYQTVSHKPPRILFERDAIDPIPFDMTLYKQLLEDNPLVCLELVHYRHPDESEKLTKKRLLHFEKFLKQNGFPMNQLDLNFSEHVTDCDPIAGCHGELIFEMTSMQGQCLQE